MKNEILNALNKRYATKKFDPEKKLNQDLLKVLIESARLTATSYGLQLMKLVLVEDMEKRKELVDAAFGQRQVVDASDLIVLCREKYVDESHIQDYIDNIAMTRNVNKNELEGFQKSMLATISNKSNEEVNKWMRNQVYIALGKLLTVCALLDIDSCPMEGFKQDEFDRILGLEKLNLTSVLLLPVGYRAKDDKNAAAKKVRRSHDNFLIRI